VEGSYADGLTRVNGQHARDIDTVASMLADLKRAPLVGLDIETTALRPYAIDRFKLPARIVTVSISTPTQGIAFPLDHPQGWAHDSHRLRAWRLLIDFLLESGRVVCHNLAFELEWLGYYIDPRITRLVSWECSQLQAHTLDERPDGLNLGDQTHIQFGFDVKKLSNLDAARILEYPIDEVLLYNALDAKWTARLFAERESDIHAVPDYQREYERKCRLASTLVLSQLQGVPVDLDYARQMEAVLSKEIADVLRKLSKCVEVQEFERRHGPFEPNNANVLLLLRDVLRRTDVSEGVSDSVAEEVLAAIPKSEALSPSLILEHRQASKLLSTYVLPVLNREIVFPDGLMHTVYKSWLARTGRLASEEPNLQNWPKRKRREIRGIVSVA
jgi:DNA polymerase I-like protein with 3'-5' exonuclease and polymerase domains